MVDDKLVLIIIELTELKKELSDIKAEIKRGTDGSRVLDRRLSLIEQRLSNFEPWISVDNSHLKYASPSGESVPASSSVAH